MQPFQPSSHNGLLVNILNREGWTGWGFDARRRKTWLTFSASLQANLKEMLLVPEVLTSTIPTTPQEEEVTEDEQTPVPEWHNGIAPEGTFIISNHADELTPWTPLLAYLSSSPFIAIPCCSHDFGGTRFRAPYHSEHCPHAPSDTQTKSKSKQVSAYTSLCSYAAYLTAAMGYIPEKEHLRIPSTRNIAIIGRTRKEEGGEMLGLQEKMEFVKGIVEKEMGSDTSIEQVKMQWLKRGSGLLKPTKDGH
jgi:tRNASer (uridine44-2'-O)-methyltransferase